MIQTVTKLVSRIGLLLKVLYVLYRNLNQKSTMASSLTGVIT